MNISFYKSKLRLADCLINTTLKRLADGIVTTEVTTVFFSREGISAASEDSRLSETHENSIKVHQEIKETVYLIAKRFTFSLTLCEFHLIHRQNKAALRTSSVPTVRQC